MEERVREEWLGTTRRTKTPITKPYDKPGNAKKPSDLITAPDITSPSTTPLQSSSQTFIQMTNPIEKDERDSNLESRESTRVSESSIESFHSFVSERAALGATLEAKMSSFTTPPTKLLSRLKLDPDQTQFESNCDELIDQFRDEYNQGNLFII